jgi:hypothetical protein
MKCPSCGKEVDAIFLYCRFCGAKMARDKKPTLQDSFPSETPEPEERNWKKKKPNILSRAEIGRWIIIPIAIISVAIFILFENWWLSVRILTFMYQSKAGIDWWRISFLDNYYFYICVAIGLLIALSDPRIIIEKDVQGKRRFYLHSKFWAMITLILEQFSEHKGSQFSTSAKAGAYNDKISLKRGILWKLAEFFVGAVVIGRLVASNMGLIYLMISKWIATQNTTWISFIQSSFSVLYVRLFTPEALGGFALADWLNANSPYLEFLTWLRTPVLIFVGVWSARLLISAILEMLLKGRIIKFLRNLIGIGFLFLIPYILQIPGQVFDVTTPFYVRTIIILMVVLTVLLVFLSLKSTWVQLSISRIFRKKIILSFIVVIVSASLLYGPVVVAIQYTPAMGGHYQDYLWLPKYLPNVLYTQWATGINSIEQDDINAAINTGTNLDILSRIRVFNDASAKLRLMPNIGVNWMDFPTPVPPATTSVDIIYTNGKEYWLAPLTIVIPPGVTGEDQWRSSRLLISHSERILALDATTGEVVPIQSVFNLTKSSYSIYYGEGGLFASSPMLYIDIPNIPETHLMDYTGPATYNGAADYILSGFDRTWFFSGLYGQEQLRWDFARGDYGDVKMLFMRDISQRLSNILLPGMTLDNDPYIISDGNNIYYSLYVYIDRSMPTQYLDYPRNQDRFWRLFATVLVNVYDGSIQGYLLGNNEDNYVLDFYRGMYPQWNQTVPQWLQSQLRYPEFLFDKQINSYNTYHVTNPDYWQRGTDFFELTTNAQSNTIEDVRYVSFFLNGTTYWAAVRLVEYANSAGKNLAGMYVALNGKDIGNVFLLRTGSTAIIGPQTALDAITNYGPTQTQLTLTQWQSGNILMYVINNRPYYFVPYYGGTATTLAPSMIVVVDAMSQKIGYYVITNPQNSQEVGSAPERAYLNLVGSEQTTEVRKENVINEFKRRGYTVKIPTQLNLPVEYQEASINYHSIADWAEVNSTISSFVTTWVAPSNTDTILMREPVVSDVKYLDLGIPINNAGIIEFHYIRVDYS